MENFLDVFRILTFILASKFEHVFLKNIIWVNLKQELRRLKNNSLMKNN